jgi:transporter family protein
MWFLLALSSAVLAGVRRTGEKRLLHQINQFTLGWIIQLLSLPVIFSSLLVTGTFLNPMSLGIYFWLPILFGMVVFYPLNTLLVGRAIKHGELSKVLPIQSFGPVLATVFGLLLLRQVPSALALLAIGLVSAGLYVLNMQGKTLHNPLRPFLEDKASLYMLLSTALIAITVPIDTIAIKASTPATYAIVSTISAALILYVTARLAHKDSLPPRKLWKSLSILGTMQGAAYIAIVIALTLGPVAYISAVKSSGILIGAVTGVVVLKEKLTKQKVISFALIGIGLTILALAK